jgi:hypothetical protein
MKPGVTLGLPENFTDSPEYSNIYAVEDGRRQWNADHRRKLSKLAWG